MKSMILSMSNLKINEIILYIVYEHISMLEKYTIWIRRAHMNFRIEIISEKGNKWG